VEWTADRLGIYRTRFVLACPRIVALNGSNERSPVGKVDNGGDELQSDRRCIAFHLAKGNDVTCSFAVGVEGQHLTLGESSLPTVTRATSQD
jgi:hypothetical protein